MGRRYTQLWYFTLVLMFAFAAVAGLSAYQDNVITQQRNLIRQMMHNSACLVDPHPVKLENF